MLLVLGIHAVRRAQSTLKMESTTRRFSDVFFCDISERLGRFDAGCLLCVFFGGAKIARYLFAGQLDTYLPSLYWSDCRGMNNVLQYSQCSGDLLLLSQMVIMPWLQDPKLNQAWFLLIHGFWIFDHYERILDWRNFPAGCRAFGKFDVNPCWPVMKKMIFGKVFWGQTVGNPWIRIAGLILVYWDCSNIWS